MRPSSSGRLPAVKWLLLIACVRGGLASTLPFPAACTQGSPNANKALSIDVDGNIFAVAICGTELRMTTSTNGGLGWSPAVVVATGAVGATVAGGTLPGHAIVAWGDGTSVLASATTDFGAAFSPPATLMRASENEVSEGLDAVAVGPDYHVMVASLTVPSGALIRRSMDRGGTWLPAVKVDIPWVYGDLLSDPMTGFLELVADDPAVYQSTSRDRGASYSPVRPLPGLCCIYYSDWAMGCRRFVYASGKVTSPTGADLVWRYRYGAATTVEQFNSLSGARARSRSITADSAGNAFTTGTVEATGAVEIVRWGAASGAPDAAVVVAARGTNPHVVACGEDSVHVMYTSSSDTIELETLCFADPCCEPVACSAPGITLLRNADVTSLAPPQPALATLLAAGDGTGLPGATALDRIAPADRFPSFTPGPLAGELSSWGAEPLVFYELEEPDAAGRWIFLRASGTDLMIDF